MRVIKWVLMVVAILVAIIVIGGLLLPRSVIVSRSTEIDAPPAVVFPYVNSLRETQKWSPWLERDPNVQVTFSGPETGVGARMTWSSQDSSVGEGSQEIIESTADQTVRSALDFGPMGTAFARFDLGPTGSGTKVTWALDADMGRGPLGRWMGLMMDNLVGADYEKGLANLKQLIETKPNSGN